MVKLCALGLFATIYNDEAGYYYNNIAYKTTWPLSIELHKFALQVNCAQIIN